MKKLKKYGKALFFYCVYIVYAECDGYMNTQAKVCEKSNKSFYIFHEL